MVIQFDIISDDDDSAKQEAGPEGKASGLSFKGVFYFIIPRDEDLLAGIERFFRESQTPLVGTALKKFGVARWRQIHLEWMPVSPAQVLWHINSDPKIEPILEQRLLEFLGGFGGEVLILRLFLYVELVDNPLPSDFGDYVFNEFSENLREFIAGDHFAMPAAGDSLIFGHIYLDSGQIEPFDVELHFNPQDFNLDYDLFVKRVIGAFKDEGMAYLCEMDTAHESFTVSYLHPCQARQLIEGLGKAEIELLSSGKKL